VQRRGDPDEGHVTTVPETAEAIAAIPRGGRSRVSLGFTAAAALGRFELQVCSQCEAVQYPPREACYQCLSERLVWKPQNGAGELLSRTVLHHSHDPYFGKRLPWHVGMVRLDCGPTVLAHLPAVAPKPPARVWVSARLDRAGQGVLVASETEDDVDLSNDCRLREMTSDPREANVLITDGRSAHSQAIVRALAAAGAGRIWVGMDYEGQVDQRRSASTFRAAVEAPEVLRELPQVTCLRLDVTDNGCVREAASAVASEIDILINTAQVRSLRSADLARAEMESHYFGLLNLAEHFAPAMGARAGPGQRLCPAWVNVLSLFALSCHPPWGTYSASMAAAHSFSQCLRAQLRETGARLVTVFPGPLEEGRSLGIPQSKLSPSALAGSIVDALRRGVEEVYPGEVAREWVEGVLDRRRVSDSGATVPR